MPARPQALIVSTDHYLDERLKQLRGPGRDAKELAAVLADPAIGGFDVRSLINQEAHIVNEEIEGFFAERGLDDLLLLYFSCHGVKDDGGRLYFASTNTKVQRLAATAISSVFVNEQMDRSRSRKVVLLLDCCYSGAFLRGMVARAGDSVDVHERFNGRGLVVITASTAMEYAFEVDAEEILGSGTPSLFTSAVVEGLRSGDADLDADGRISVDELYDYVYTRVRESTPDQTPSKMSSVQGELHIARSPRQSRPQPLAPLPSDRAPEPRLGATPTRGIARRPLWALAGLAIVAVSVAVFLLRPDETTTPDEPSPSSPASTPAASTSGRPSPTRPAPSPTAAPATAGVVSQGASRLADSAQGFDLLDGQAVNFVQGNLAWITETRSLAVFDETTLGVAMLGRVPFEGVTPRRLAGLRYGEGSANPLLDTPDIPPGTVLAVRVDARTYAKVAIDAVEPDGALRFRWVTYRR